MTADRRKIPPEVQGRADVLMMAWLKGILQAGMSWPGIMEYQRVYSLALQRALDESLDRKDPAKIY